jgi:FixJ family two-component response regulator
LETNKKLPTEALVYVVDDDASICSSLSSLLRSEGIQVRTFASTDSFLNSEMPDVPSCLILDVRLQGASGLTLQQESIRERIRLPIIFLTSHGDIAMSVQAMKAGAFDVLSKPFRDHDMLDTVVAALKKDYEQRSEERLFADIQSRYETLTPREKEVVSFVVEGLMNKQIADRMGLSQVTVKIHRSQAMRKMDCRSVPDLVRKLQRVKIPNQHKPK